MYKASANSTVKPPGEIGGISYWRAATNSLDDGTKRSICEGDDLVCKEIAPEDWKTEIDWEGGVFILHTPFGDHIRRIPGYSEDVLPASLSKLYKVNRVQSSTF